MKRLIILILSIISCFQLFLVLNNKLSASAETEQKFETQSVYLIEAESGKVLYSKNENQRKPIASMTKLMLLNLCFEKIEQGELSLDEKITVSQNASGMGGSQVFLEKDGKYLVRDLIKSVIVASANDASVALAERIYGSENACVDVMNAKCAEWNLKDSLFSNCTGLPKPTQYSSAKDVSVMLQNLIKHKDYFTFSNIWIDEIEHRDGRKTGLTNTNKLVKFYDGCDGGKTGFTSEAGFCLAATAKRGALRLIAVAINSPDSKTRFGEVSSLFNYGFDNFVCKTAVDKSKPLEIEAKVEKGIKKTVKVIPADDVHVLSKRNEKDKIVIDFKPKKIKAPILSGEKIGELIVYKDNVEYKRVDVNAFENVMKKTYFHYLKDVALNW